MFCLSLFPTPALIIFNLCIYVLSFLLCHFYLIPSRNFRLPFHLSLFLPSIFSPSLSLLFSVFFYVHLSFPSNLFFLFPLILFLFLFLLFRLRPLLFSVSTCSFSLSVPTHHVSYSSSFLLCFFIPYPPFSFFRFLFFFSSRISPLLSFFFHLPILSFFYLIVVFFSLLTCTYA